MAEFRYQDAFSATGPEPAPRFAGLPRYNFVYGHNDPAQIPAEELADIAARVLRERGSSLAMYHLGHGPQGYLALREFVAGKLGDTRAISCTAEDVVLTSGSLQGMDLVNETFLEAGDTAIIEAFTYGGAIGKLKRLGVTPVGAPLDSDGIRMDSLENILKDLHARGIRPKFIYTIPTVQNPTGSIMPLERRRRLLELSAAYNVPIFEDECYADLAWEDGQPPALYALDPTRVVHIGSFSKSLAPALRVGYIVGAWEVLSRVLARKTDAGSGAIEQMIIAEYFGREFKSHVSSLKTALRRKLDVMVDALEREFGTSAELFVPKGGIFLWLSCLTRSTSERSRRQHSTRVWPSIRGRNGPATRRPRKVTCACASRCRARRRSARGSPNSRASRPSTPAYRNTAPTYPTRIAGRWDSARQKVRRPEDAAQRTR